MSIGAIIGITARNLAKPETVKKITRQVQRGIRREIGDSFIALRRTSKIKQRNVIKARIAELRPMIADIIVQGKIDKTRQQAQRKATKLGQGVLDAAKPHK